MKLDIIMPLEATPVCISISYHHHQQQQQQQQ
jgi:hypothetical protein